MTPAEHYNAGITTLLDAVAFWFEGESIDVSGKALRDIQDPPSNPGQPSAYFKDGFNDAREVVLENLEELAGNDFNTRAASLVSGLRVAETE